MLERLVSRRALPPRHSLFILIKNFARTRRGHPWLSLTGANRAFSRASAAASSNSVTSPTSTRRRFKASRAFCSNSSAAMRAALCPTHSNRRYMVLLDGARELGVLVQAATVF